jgi:hypothetical protein
MSTYRYHAPEEPPVASVKYSKVAQSLAEELENPASPGERHSQVKRTIMPLIEVGLSDSAIFAQYRGMYDAADFPDDEIDALIKWGRNRVAKANQGERSKPQPKEPEYTDEEKIRNALDWLGSFRVTPEDLWEESQVRSGNEPEAILYLSLFQASDFVNLNSRYLIRKLKNGSEKAELCGPGETRLAAEWIEYIQANGTPEGRAGAWIRINPLRSIRGDSSSGAHTDADVLRYTRLLLESDVLPFDVALSLLAKVPLPICAITDPAGRGPHGIVAINAVNAQDYTAKAKAVLDLLAPFGIDAGNANPSRYSRLPGAHRIIGARNSATVQRLLYLSPQPRTEGIFS